MDDFWVASGHHLIDRNDAGGLVLTDDFIKAYLARPELMPPAEACPVERGLHRQLLESPRALLTADELALIADADARENFSLFLAFRDHLLSYGTLEAAYLALVTKGMAGLPPLFIQQLTHVIARNAFDGVEDARVLRAGECFFRPQRATFHEGAVLLADAEAIESHEENRHASPLLKMLGGPAVSELEILTDENAAGYKARSDAHDLVFDLSQIKPGRDAFAAAFSVWIQHLLGFSPVFEPVERLEQESFAWFIAADADATEIGNRVWAGETVSGEDQQRILALFRFTIPDHPRVLDAHRGKAGFAIMAMGKDRLLRIKPQNLIAGLPLERVS